MTEGGQGTLPGAYSLIELLLVIIHIHNHNHNMPQRLKEEEDEAGSDGGYFDGDNQDEFDELQGDASDLYVPFGPVSRVMSKQ